MINVFYKPTHQTFQILEKEAELLKQYEVTPPSWVKYDSTRPIRPHRCFEMAQSFVRKNIDTTNELVYIYCFWSERKFVDHAFVLINNEIVYDGVYNKFYNKEDYYRENEIVEIRRKSPKQVIEEHARSFDISQDDWTARLKYM